MAKPRKFYTIKGEILSMKRKSACFFNLVYFVLSSKTNKNCSSFFFLDSWLFRRKNEMAS